MILQDSVTLREAFPHHPLWLHCVFHHPAYQAFATQMKSSCPVSGEESTQNISVRIQQAMPELVDNLQLINNRILDQSRIQEQNTTQIKSQMNTLSERLQVLTTGGLMVRLEMTPHGPPTVVPLVSPSPRSPPSPSLFSAPSAQLQSLQTPPLQPPLQSLDSAAPPQYRMRRDIRTVEQLYREWTVGLQGSLSILELNRRYGPRWRAGRNDEIQFYSLRSEIIREINRIELYDHVNEITAVQRLQGRQDRENWSMDKLCKILRAEAKKRREVQRRYEIANS